MPAGPDFTPRNPGKRYNCIFYWLTRHVALVLACLCPQGRSLGTQTFRVAWVFRILLTHTFRAAGVLHFYTFRVAEVLHFDIVVDVFEEIELVYKQQVISWSNLFTYLGSFVSSYELSLISWTT